MNQFKAAQIVLNLLCKFYSPSGLCILFASKRDTHECCNEELLQLEDDETDVDCKEQCLDEKCIVVEGATPTLNWHSIARDTGLAASLRPGYYPEFVGIQGPSQVLYPKDSSSFDCLSLLWLPSLCLDSCGNK